MNNHKSPIIFLLFVFFFIASTTPSHAGSTLANYSALPAVDMMVLAADGKTVVFRKYSPKKDMIVAYSLEKNEVTQAVDVTGIKPIDLKFLDRKRVVIIGSESNKRILGYKGMYEMSTAFLWDISSGNVTQLLTPGDVIMSGQLGLGNITGRSPDGKHLFMPALVSKKRNRGDWEIFLSEQHPNNSLLKIDLDSPDKPEVFSSGSRDTVEYFLNSKGELLAEEIFNDHADYFQVLSYYNGEAKEIRRSDTDIRFTGATAVTQDGKSLLYFMDSKESDRSAYYLLSLVDGKMSKPLFERADVDVYGVIRDINKVAYGVIYSGLRPSYEFFDKSLTERMEKIQATFPDHSVWLRDWSPDWHHLLVFVEGTTSAGDYYLFSGDSARFLAAARPNISADAISPVIEFKYRARDGAVIPALLTMPLSGVDNPQNLPAVMLPHGGPESQDWVGFDWMAQALASQGYLVIQPQFRGSKGFGVEHRMAGRGEWGRKSQQDITDGLKSLIAQKLVDPNRVCIMGGSYGGFAALAGGAFTPDLYKCVVSVNGVSDVRQMLSEEQADHGRHHWAVSYWKEVAARGDTDKSNLDMISPAKSAEKFAAPVLLLHGDKDDVVRYAQSKTMHRQLKRFGKEVELVKLKGEDHYLSNSETRAQMLEAAVSFINKHIGIPGGEK